MNFQEFVKKGLLIKEKVGFDQINKVIEKAFRNLEIAKTLLKEGYEDGSFRFAYEAMLLTGRALVFSFGFRPRTIGSHKIVIDFIEKVFGNQYKVLIQKFDKMRKTRNYLIYGIGLTISKTEAENAIKTAGEFIKIVEEKISQIRKQKKLI